MSPARAAIIGGALILGLTTLLSNCSERIVYLSPEQIQQQREIEAQQDRDRLEKIQRALPPGCTFKELGSYFTRSGTSVIASAVFCGKQVTTNLRWSSGKSSRYASLATVVE